MSRVPARLWSGKPKQGKRRVTNNVRHKGDCLVALNVDGVGWDNCGWTGLYSHRSLFLSKIDLSLTQNAKHSKTTLL